jgi:hypothetical protein
MTCSTGGLPVVGNPPLADLQAGYMFSKPIADENG